MSRHHITDSSDTVANPRYEVIVGWDNGLNTYFFQVWDTNVTPDDFGSPDFSAGYIPDEVPDVPALVKRLTDIPIAPQVFVNSNKPLSNVVMLQLEFDKKQARPRTEFQETNLNILREMVRPVNTEDETL